MVATENLDNEMLADLAEKLPDYLFNCREDNTIKKYYYSFNN